MSAFASFLVLIFIIAVIVQFFRRKWKSVGWYSLATIVALGVSGYSYQPQKPDSASASTNQQAAATDAPESAATDAPAADDTPSKSTLLSEVDHSITPEKLAGNPEKYNKDVVRFHCKISNVLAGDQDGVHQANAECGSGNTSDMTSEDYHLPSNIVLMGKSIGSMDAGESVTVLGTATYDNGKNMMGGDQVFPEVMVYYAE